MCEKSRGSKDSRMNTYACLRMQKKKDELYFQVEFCGCDEKSTECETRNSHSTQRRRHPIELSPSVSTNPSEEILKPTAPKKRICEWYGRFFRRLFMFEAQTKIFQFHELQTWKFRSFKKIDNSLFAEWHIIFPSNESPNASKRIFVGASTTKRKR